MKVGRRAALIALILLAAWLRLWRLALVPPGLWFDEALNGMEALWMVESGQWPIFVLVGQGREVLFHYLLALASILWGAKVYTIRLIPALLGVLSVPLMYRWVRTLFPSDPQVGAVALVATAGLVVSLPYLIMNRVAYRVNILLPLMLLTLYYFWRGWRSRRLHFYLLAGIGLGLSQYTYLAGRLLFLVFPAFVLIQTGLQPKRPALKSDWSGLGLMLGVALLLVTPLAFFFARYPELFLERSADVALDTGAVQGGELFRHWLAAGRVFIDGEDPNWRHHLPGRPVFDWFGAVGFWLGLIGAARHYRRPVNLFLLVTLAVMWLPAPLTDPPLHTLRLVGTLPPYYTLMALGWLGVADRLTRLLKPLQLSPAAIALGGTLLVSGSLNVHTLFYRWASHPQVYQAFDGPVVELADSIQAMPPGESVVIPFYFYKHAALRYLLHPTFPESVLLPPQIAAQLDDTRLIIPEYPRDAGHPPALVWLVKDDAGRGTAYVSAVRRGLSLAEGEPTPILDRYGNLNAQQYPLSAEQLQPFFPNHMPHKTANAVWAEDLRLQRYEFQPPRIQPGESSTLTLAWEIVGYAGLPGKLFVQLLDDRGRPVTQAELPPISAKMYRWRKAGLILEQIPLHFGAELPPGLYFARLGFFLPESGQRLPVSRAGQPLPGNELIVGPLALGRDMRQPAYPMQARLDDKIELVGYDLYPEPGQTAQTTVELAWQSLRPVEQDYTVFVQLLDAQDRVIAQVDAQPLPGLYPTSRWQPGDYLVEQFLLPVPRQELTADRRLVTGMYDLDSGARLPTYDSRGRPLPDGMIPLNR